MSLYSSREPFQERGKLEGAYSAFNYSYERPQNNPTNRILTVLRRPETDIYDLLLSLNSRWAVQFTLAEENHAREVIERVLIFRRMAALEKEES